MAGLPDSTRHVADVVALLLDPPHQVLDEVPGTHVLWLLCSQTLLGVRIGRQQIEELLLREGEQLLDADDNHRRSRRSLAIASHTLPEQKTIRPVALRSVTDWSSTTSWKEPVVNSSICSGSAPCPGGA